MDPVKTPWWDWDALFSMTLVALAIIGAITVGFMIVDSVGSFIARVCQ